MRYRCAIVREPKLASEPQFPRSLVVLFEQVGVTDDQIDGGSTAGDPAGINHQVGQASIGCAGDRSDTAGWPAFLTRRGEDWRAWLKRAYR